MGVLIDDVPATMLQQVKAGLLNLSPAEYEVLRGVLAGLEFAQIGSSMGIDKRTADSHWARVIAACGNRRGNVIRACHVLENDPEVAAYLSALPPRSQGGRFRRAR